LTCSAGQIIDSCTPLQPSAETCDNIDNDCDGSIDENVCNTDETGSIKVTSAHSGAAIFLDGMNTGLLTPDTITNVPVGNHEVYVTLSGHIIPDAKTVVVELNDKVNVHFILKSEASDYGSIMVTSAPSGATIFIDGENTGKFTPNTVTEVPVGSHEVYVTITGYTTPGTATVNVFSEVKANIHFILKNKPRIILQ
jgi:hypothetical protein